MGLQLTHRVGSLAWWRGAISVLFGVTALWSGTFLTMLVLGLGIYALVDGFSALIASLLARYRRDPGWPLALRGVARIPIGVLVCVRPSAAGPALLFAIVAWAMLTGALDVVAMLDQLRHTYERQRRQSWDGAVRRQRQMSWDGVIERNILYARAEQMSWGDRSDRKLSGVPAERPGDRRLIVGPASHAAQSAGRQEWEQL
ncbi:MAG: DUF308 domain-containing protein, partial [Anaerolineae bacterium]